MKRLFTYFASHEVAQNSFLSSAHAQGIFWIKNIINDKKYSLVPDFSVCLPGILQQGCWLRGFTRWGLFAAQVCVARLRRKETRSFSRLWAILSCRRSDYLTSRRFERWVQIYISSLSDLVLERPAKDVWLLQGSLVSDLKHNFNGWKFPNHVEIHILLISLLINVGRYLLSTTAWLCCVVVDGDTRNCRFREIWIHETHDRWLHIWYVLQFWTRSVSNMKRPRKFVFAQQRDLTFFVTSYRRCSGERTFYPLQSSY